MLYLFFFFKQKTAYEMRISDWSSDVCSSDLPRRARRLSRALLGAEGDRTAGVLDQRTWRPLGVQYRCGGAACRAAPGNLLEPRSEEHTSELQSLMRISYAVFCLKKKKIHNEHTQ